MNQRIVKSPNSATKPFGMARLGQPVAWPHAVKKDIQPIQIFAEDDLILAVEPQQCVDHHHHHHLIR